MTAAEPSAVDRSGGTPTACPRTRGSLPLLLRASDHVHLDLQPLGGACGGVPGNGRVGVAHDQQVDVVGGWSGLPRPSRSPGAEDGDPAAELCEFLADERRNVVDLRHQITKGDEHRRPGGHVHNSNDIVQDVDGSVSSRRSANRAGFTRDRGVPVQG